MATPNRMAILTKMHKVLKKHYKSVPIPDRPVLEHLLFACCLENAHYEPAERAVAALRQAFFDWNEVRVSTVKELAEVMHHLPQPASAATNLKKVLQGVFESTYSFDLETLKKLNLGQAIQRLKKHEGATPFVIAYITQAALGGHAIPLDEGLLQVMNILGLASEEDVKQQVVPGLERAIPKSKGIEFASLAHQLGADMYANPYAPSVHKVLLEISPDAKTRLPKRPPKSARAKDDEAGKRVPSAGEAKATPAESSAAPASRPKPPPKTRPQGAKPPATTKRTEGMGETAKSGAGGNHLSDGNAGSRKKSEKVSVSRRKPR